MGEVIPEEIKEDKEAQGCAVSTEMSADNASRQGTTSQGITHTCDQQPQLGEVYSLPISKHSGNYNSIIDPLGKHQHM